MEWPGSILSTRWWPQQAPPHAGCEQGKHFANIFSINPQSKTLRYRQALPPFTDGQTGLGASLVAQMVQCLLTVWETWLQSLGWEDSLEKEMATHSSTLAWNIPWMEEPGRLQSMVAKSWTRLSEWLHFLSIVPFGEGNGNPLQCSGLENPMDGGAWWAIVYGVAKSRTQLNTHTQSHEAANAT